MNVLAPTAASGSQTYSWTPTTIRQSVLDATNPNYPRLIQLDANVVAFSKRINGVSYTAVMPLSVILPAVLALVPQLTWPPIIVIQPSSTSVAAPAIAAFTVVSTSEITITYQWQISTDSGVTFTDLTNAGVYSDVTTLTMNISNSTGLNTNQYRCVCTNGSGSTTTSAAVLTVT